ncbi:MAG: acyl-CoA desaturase [Betaproteobacteria bacterium]|jgi:stearoyl-CoA desaturase (delta-9 desaturase)|nr:acyl-CoA desaturase [Betaproteobacteria bacterium]
MFTGVYDLPWWGYVVYALVMTHVTIAGVTIYLHRHQAHRALELHPLPSHFFRFWLWLTTGMVTKEWAAIHRKHHAKCETTEDPHSPQIYGINKVMWEGAELYRKESVNKETLERYGHGTPDDWIERKLYSRFTVLGISLMLVTNFVLFGFIGITIWAVQMIWIPLTAAGVINGIGHYWGYRTFQPADASRNIVPWGILIGGEELHNNHHAYGTSARLSNRWYEFDIGWMYIRCLQMLGLADVKKIAPRLKLDRAKTHCDVATLQAVVTHRYEVLAKYAKSLRTTCADEMRSLRASAVSVDLRALKRWLHIDTSTLPQIEREQRERVLKASTRLATVYTMRDELAALWQRSTASKEQLVHQLEDWCRRAEASGIEALQTFSRRLRCYA